MPIELVRAGPLDALLALAAFAALLVDPLLLHKIMPAWPRPWSRWRSAPPCRC